MGRIALFVIVVAGGSYFLLQFLAQQVSGVSLRPAIGLSLSVILAVLLWTALIWWLGERLGQRDEPGGPGPGAGGE